MAAKPKEDIKVILDDYKKLHKEELATSVSKKQLYQNLYNDFMSERENAPETDQSLKGFFYFVNILNKLYKSKAYYCGVNMFNFGNKLKAKHNYALPFDINLLYKDNDGVFVMKKKLIPDENNANTKESFEFAPIEKNQYSIFYAFVQLYLDSVIDGVNLKSSKE